MDLEARFPVCYCADEERCRFKLTTALYAGRDSNVVFTDAGNTNVWLSGRRLGGHLRRRL